MPAQMICKNGETRSLTGKVLDVDAGIAVRLSLAPEQQSIFGRLLLAAVVLLVHIDLDLLDLKSQYDGPDETEDESRIAVDDIFRADALETNLRSERDEIIFAI